MTSVHDMTSSWFRRFCAVAALLGMTCTFAVAQQFPFDQEMLLETKRLPGLRRVPMMEIHPDGKASVDLWCHNAVAQVTIAGGEIKFTFASATPSDCTPERIELDQRLAKAMLEISNWSRQNDIITFAGPTTTLRFRLSTH